MGGVKVFVGKRGEDRARGRQLQCWDLYVGAQIDVFGKATVLKQADLKTAEWNKFYGSFLTEVSRLPSLQTVS